jgi:hypothetical protein
LQTFGVYKRKINILQILPSIEKWQIFSDLNAEISKNVVKKAEAFYALPCTSLGKLTTLP